MNDLIGLWLMINGVFTIVNVMELKDFISYYHGLNKYSDFFVINKNITIGNLVVGLLLLPHLIAMTLIALLIITWKVKIFKSNNE